MAISGGPKLRNLITNASVRNAMIMLQAVGGSTNGLIHVIAIAARAGARDLTEFLSLTDAAQDSLNLQSSRLRIEKPERWKTTEHEIGSLQPFDRLLVAADEMFGQDHHASQAI
jgi:hypothetical protein